MADDRRIVIELKNIESGSAAEKTNQIAEKNSNDLQKTLKTLFHPIKTLENQTISQNVIVNQAVHQGIQLVKKAGVSAASYAINKYFTLNENYKAEVDFSNMMTGIGKVTGFAGSIGAGAIAGAIGGPVGAVIGGVIGAVGWGVSEGFGAAERRLQQQITISTNNYQSQFQQTRLGLTEGRGVTNQ